MRPRKRLVYVIDCREELTDVPLTIDPTGVWFRPEGANFICGVSPEEGNDPDSTDFELDYSLFEELIWPTLANRVPAFEAIKLIRAWAGPLRLQRARPERHHRRRRRTCRTS